MPTVLSTKKLSPSQKNLLLNKGISLVEYDAIKIEFLEFENPIAIKNVIITSRNAAKAILKKDIRIERCFCVGEKTSEFLSEKGMRVSETANYGADLAKIIAEKHSGEEFIFFCGDKRREELPSILKGMNISLKEIEVYRSRLNEKNFPQEFDGILFFSPYGIKSFVSKNSLNNSTVFCIGTTTASEAGKHTQNIIIATKPSVENVIVQVVKKLSRND